MVMFGISDLGGLNMAMVIKKCCVNSFGLVSDLEARGETLSEELVLCKGCNREWLIISYKYHFGGV